ncbi:uncharacterized protein LOC119094361 [Pollicipes pollicipes]|uniref:uncharacterized protein LOC119094361 n=1 Tax=Pollicipes pollicipes TaxID=41117 RepID=UPI001884E902|nr:uncharacterized protein LOC119094361 [Pollicipes pollicipes]
MNIKAKAKKTQLKGKGVTAKIMPSTKKEMKRKSKFNETLPAKEEKEKQTNGDEMCHTRKRKKLKTSHKLDNDGEMTPTKMAKKIKTKSEGSDASEMSPPKTKKIMKGTSDIPDNPASPEHSLTSVLADGKKRKPMRKKKQYNKEAIEKMKARQVARREKAQKQTPAAKPDAKRRRAKLPVRLEAVNLTFAEDDTMTEFDGVWVPREETGRLQSAREDLEKRGLAPEKVHRRMKQLVRREHRRLKLRLIGALAKTERAARERAQFLAARNTPRARRRLPGRACGLRLQEGDRLARFDGFWAGTVCFRCGAAGHRLSDCPRKGDVAGLPFATCFLCQQKGHMSRDCPQGAADAGRRPGRTSPVGGGAGAKACSWRGLTHDAEEADEAAPAKVASVKKAAPVKAKTPAKKKESSGGHVRFDFD